MKTHIELDDKLLAEVFELGGFATKKAAVNTALAEYVKLLKRRELLEMRGKIRWEGDLDEMRMDRRVRRWFSSTPPSGSTTSTLAPRAKQTSLLSASPRLARSYCRAWCSPKRFRACATRRVPPAWRAFSRRSS